MAWAICRPDDEDGPWPIFERVLDFPELHKQSYLSSIGVRWAFAYRIPSEHGWINGGKRILGTACMPAVSGSLSSLFDQLLEDAVGYTPDFLITLNSDYWQTASDREREILVFHELLHCGQAKDQFGADKYRKSDGAPVLGMVAHDLEEFCDVVARYGAWKGDIQEFLDAAADGAGRGPPPTSNSKVMVGEELAEVIREMAGELDLDTATPADVTGWIDRKLDELSAEDADQALAVEVRPANAEDDDLF